jgi:ABC-type dipeptide/oligopeptide/nickel transport system permease subunit
VRERAIVIKEACGNSSAAFAYMAILLFIRQLMNWLFHHHRLWDDWTILINGCFFIIVLLSARVLWRAHHYHSKREKLFREEHIKAHKPEEENTMILGEDTLGNDPFAQKR